jgi:large subunit ribosomal protein L15
MPLQRRIPKRGFRNTFGARTCEVTLSQLENAAIDGVVDMEGLLLRRIVRGRPDVVKVIMTGELSQAITVRGLRVSAGAKTAIESAGGKVEE